MKQHTNWQKALSLMLVLVMVLSLVLPAVPVLAAETTEELPTEIVTDSTVAETEESIFYQTNFSEDAVLADFDLYQSGSSKFTISNGELAADGTDGEQKAILKQGGKIKSLSVDIIPGESGVIYGGVYFGAKDAQNGQDAINSQVILIKSDYTGWSDAANRIDIVYGQFNNGWKSIKTTISETGSGNNLFSGGKKQPLNLRLDFSYDVVLLTLSLVSDSSKYVQVIYEIEPALIEGQVGLRNIGSDTRYDKLIVNHDYIPETLTEGMKLDGTGLDSYAKTTGNLTEKPVTIEAWVWVPKLAGGSRRQAIITNYQESSVAKNPVGTWGLYTNEYQTLYYTERTAEGTFNHTLGVAVCNNSWSHVAIVRRQGALDVYFNGEFVKTIEHAGMGDPTVVERPLTIGYCSVGAGTEGINSLKGQVGDIRIWNTERTLTQIQDNMYREMTGKEAGLIQHWNFDSHKEGIISNTVEGGLDAGVMGHAEIGDEGIYRWDFSTEAQMEDFTFYYAPTYTDDKYNYAFNIKDEKLYIAGSINNSSTEVKAILNQKIDNIKYIGADVTQGGTSTANVAMLFGIKGVNSEAVNDYEGYRVRLTRCRTSSAKRPYGEIDFNKVTNGTSKAVTSAVANSTFFPGADEKRPFHIQLGFEGNTVNALMYRLDDPNVTLAQSYTVADGETEGQVGLWLGRTSVSFDDLVILTALEKEEPPVQDETVTYNNDGYNFMSSGGLTWEMKQEITTPYTMEAWIKVPAGIADGTVGYIVGNPYRAPHTSMQMIADGNLRLAWTVENADLTKTTTNYDVAVDLRNGKWTHVAYTCDVANDTVTAYINGQVMKTWTDAGLQDIVLPDHISPDNFFAVGSKKTNMSASSNLFPGWIADVRLWDHVLSASEIQSSMLTQYTTAKDGLLFNAPLNEMVDNKFADLSGNGYDLEKSVTGFLLETQEHEPGAYSMVVIPDQQILSHYYNAELQGMYQWIADNREKENIQIVMNVGDMADNCGNLDQWKNTKAAVELLPDDLPFIAAPGNHDYDTNSGWNKGYGVREQLTLMNEYLPRSMFEGYPTEIGFFDEVNSANQWQAFTVNGNKYLVMALEYVPQDDVIAWANQVAEEHADHQIIMVTHSYVGNTGNLDQPKLWSEFLSKHENVIMAFSGHVFHTEVVHRTDKGENGNDVHNILMDAQGLDTSNRKYAMVGILRFNADGTLCDISYYSTSRDQYETRSNFTVQLPAQEHNDVAKVGETYYSSVTEAATAANGQIVEILENTDEAITIAADVTIDLAGFQLSNVTVAEGAKLNLIDSTATYEGTNGSAVVTGNVQTLTESDGNKYMVIGENGVYAAHKYYVGITHVSIDPSVTGFGYKAQFYGDEAVQAQIANIGYDLWLTEDIVVSRTTDFKNVVTLRLKNFMVDAYGEAPVNAKVYMTLTDGTKAESAVHSYSMRSMVELINETYENFTAQQLKAVAAMILKSETMQAWEVANILAALQPRATVEDVVVENQEMVIYGGATANLTLSGGSKFTVADTVETLQGNPYADWIADYYVSMDTQAQDGLFLAGNYGSYGWIALPVPAGQTYNQIPVLSTMLNTSVTYADLVTFVGEFTCGVADTQNANGGATVTVELRLTNPQDANDYIVITSTQVSLDPTLSTKYVAVEGGVSVADTVITTTADNTLVLHESATMTKGTYFAQINTTDNTKPAGIVFGANEDATSYYLFRLGNGSKVELVSVVNGVETVLDTGYYPANRRKDVFSGLEIVVDGTTIHGYIHNPHYDRVHCFSVHEDAEFAGNHIGLWSAAEGVVFQNTTVTANTTIRKADVLIFGHSYTEMWTNYQSYFPEYTSIDNMGLGGSVAVQWEQFPEELASYEPKLGIYLIGINDLTGGTTPKAVVTSMEKTLLAIKELVPEFEVVVTAVNHCPNRATITAEISQCNALMRNLAASYDWIYYAETEYALCKDPSDPLSADSGLFSDGLHPNAAGYTILVDAIRIAAKGENQPAFDDALAQEQLAEVKAEKMAYLSVYAQNAYTEENWALAEPYYNAAVAKIDACTTEMQLKNLDLSQELAQLDAIRNKAADVVANLQNPETSIQRSTLKWVSVDDYTINLTGSTYSLDSTAVYKNPEGIFKFSNNSGAVGTAGLLLNAHTGANKGMYGYLINCNTNGNYIQIYYVSNSYNNDGSSSATKYIGGIVLNNYGLRVEDTEFWFKLDGDKLYVNTVERKEKGEANMLVVDLTYDGAYEVYESGYVGMLAWASSVSYDIQLQRFAAEEVIVEEEEPVDDLADDVVTNLMTAATSDGYGIDSWQTLDAKTVHANGYSYGLDNTTVYSDSEAVFKLSNATGNVGTAGLFLRANQRANSGVDGYLVNVNTTSSFIQVYYVNNAYNLDGTAHTVTYLGGIVLNNYGITAAGTEFYTKIEGDKLYVNTVARQQEGTGNIVAVDLTLGGQLAVYPNGHTGILSWVKDVSFDFQLKNYTGTAVDVNGADEALTHIMNKDTALTYGNATWNTVDANTLQLTGCRYTLDSTKSFSYAQTRFTLSDNTGHIGTGGILLRATKKDNNGIDAYLINYNINSNYIQIYYMNNYYAKDGTETALTYLGGLVLKNYGITNVDTEFVATIDGGKLYVNTTEREQAGTADLITVDLTKGGTYEVYESGYFGLLSWVSGVTFNMNVAYLETR